MELELWQLISLGIAFISFTTGFGKILLDQVEKRQAERFLALDKARDEGQRALRDTFDAHIIEERKNAETIKNLERDFLRWQADLPLQYVRREDYVRGQSVIEAKLDALYNKLEVVQLRSKP